MEIEVRTKGFPQLQEAIKEMPIAAMRAARRANRKAADYARGQFVKEMSAQTGVQQALLRSRRAKVYYQSTIETQGSTKMWFGYTGMRTAYEKGKVLPFGKLKQDEGGALAGKYYFERSFIAKFRSGHVGIFKREGKKLIEQLVEFPQALAIADAVAADTNDRLGTLLDQELRYERLKGA